MHMRMSRSYAAGTRNVGRDQPLSALARFVVAHVTFGERAMPVRQSPWRVAPSLTVIAGNGVLRGPDR